MTTSLNATRAADTLILLGKAGVEGMALKEISADLKAAKPSVLRCLNALIESGFAEQVTRGRYRLGPAIFSLARSETAIETEVDHWRPVLEEVVEAFGQTVYLVRRAGKNVVVADKQIGTAPIQALVSDIGGRLPMGLGTGSVAILSTFDEVDWRQIVEQNSEKYADWGVKIDEVAELVKTASIQGYVYDMEIFIPDCAGIALPIRDPGRYDANLALTLSSPSSFLRRNKPSDVAGRIKSIIETHRSSRLRVP